MNPAFKATIKRIPGVMPLVALRNSLRPKPTDFHDLVRRLFLKGQEGIGLSTIDFLASIDRAKHEFSKRAKPDLSLKLQVIKALNLLVNKHEYLNFAVKKVGRPSGFMLDTVNACQLGCATCQHSYNKEWTAATFVPMPNGTMKPDTFEAFIRAVGLRSYAGHFYNNSEPFLNKKTPQYLHTANLYRIQTMVSSNMSIPRLDAEAIVESGLNLLMTAIDGTTQEVYQKYRRGGHINQAFENVCAIVAAKKRLNSPTPRLRWQFLTFQHNIHQVEDAIELARTLGYDSFNVATPYDVSADDPSIYVGIHPKAGTDVVFTGETPANWNQNLKPIADEIEAAFNESFVERHEKVGRNTSSIKPTQGYCDWLHLGIISDALGRIHPCCLPDFKNQGSFVFGNLQKNGAEIFNSEKYQQARLLFADEKTYHANKLEGREKQSKCENCSSRPLPQIGLGAIDGYFQSKTNEPYQASFNQPLMRDILLGWNRHNEVFHA